MILTPAPCETLFGQLEYLLPSTTERDDMVNLHGTDYNIVLNPAHYRACHKFLRDNKVKPVKLTYPTLVAEREGEIIGLMGTLRSDKAVIAGPVYVSIPNSPVSYRLIEVYEQYLKSKGIKKFIFSVDVDNHKWLNMVQRVGVYKKTGTKGNSIWFERTLQ